MNTVEANQIKEKIDSVLDKAARFGQQSEQFIKARTALNEHIAETKSINEALSSLTNDMKNIVTLMSNFTKQEFTEGIEPAVKSVEQSAKRCQEYINGITNEYDSALEKLRGSQKILKDQQEEKEQQVNGVVNEIRALLGSYTTQLNQINDLVTQSLGSFGEKQSTLTDNIHSLSNEINNSISESSDSINSAINESNNSILQQVKSGIADLQSNFEKSTLSDKLDKLTKAINKKSAHIQSSQVISMILSFLILGILVYIGFIK